MNVWIKVGKRNVRYMLVSRCDQYLFTGYSLSCLAKGSGRIRVRCSKVVGKNRVRIYAHRLIMRPKDGEFVDHVNHDQLDNTRDNLRIVNNHQNSLNKHRIAVHNVYKRPSGLYFYTFYNLGRIYKEEGFEKIKHCFLAMIKKRKELLKDNFTYYNHYDPNLITENEDIKVVCDKEVKKKSSFYLKASSSGSSSFKGVRKRGSKFLSEINHKSRCIHLGVFSSEIKAAESYDRAAIELKGLGCELNFPSKHNQQDQAAQLIPE